MPTVRGRRDESARHIRERQRNNLRRIAIDDSAGPPGSQFLDGMFSGIDGRRELTQLPDREAGEACQAAILRGPREDARPPQDDAAVC
jgi:hypothetical protein